MPCSPLRCAYVHIEPFFVVSSKSYTSPYSGGIPLLDPLRATDDLYEDCQNFAEVRTGFALSRFLKLIRATLVSRKMHSHCLQTVSTTELLIHCAHFFLCARYSESHVNVPLIRVDAPDLPQPDDRRRQPF